MHDFWKVFTIIGTVAAGFATILFVVAGAIMNVVDLVTTYSEMAQAEIIIRLVGLFILPLGAAMGWFA